MKNILIAFLVSFSVCADAQKDTSGIQFIKLSDSTELGAPDGKLVTKKIGSSGGTIISDDGRIELVFPAGALIANTDISIQPTSNPLSNGAGKAYWFEPSGTQFKKPVQFIFHYNDEEADNCPPELMAIALQDRKGKWSYIEYEDWDSAGKKLKGYIHHFTGATSVFRMWMTIGKTELRVNESTSIDFVSYLNEGDEALFATNQYLTWKVNNDKNGNEVVGRIRQLTVRVEKKAKMINAIYTAPNILPFSDTLYIKAEVFVYNRKKMVPVGRTLKKKITIYDMYKISVIYKKTTSPAITDSASFIVTVKPNEAIITDMLNYPPVVKIGDPYACSTKIILDESCVGIIDIAAADIGGYRISRNHPPEIYFEFREKQNLVCKFQYICKAGGITNSSPVENLVSPSEPKEVAFIANGQKQTINYFPNPYTIIVNRVRRE